MSKPSRSAAPADAKTVNISARIPRDVGAKLDALRDLTRRDKSQLIVEALTAYVALLDAGYMVAADPMLADRRTPAGGE